MPIVASCTFREPAKTYFLDPGELEITAGMHVVAETSRGLEVGVVKFAPRPVEDDKIVPPLRSIVRVATRDDLEINAQNREREDEALKLARERIRHFDLPMKPVKAEIMLDRAKMYLFYESEDRVDFRDLLRDLSGRLNMRMHFQQVGPRDAAKVIGGCGPCGQPLCCATFLTSMPPVTLKMAKEQGLALTPHKISGACGRLMCCLRYEVDFYRDMNMRLPNPKSPVDTPEGPGHVIEVRAIRDEVVVVLGDGRHIVVPGDDLRDLRTERGPVKACKNHVKNGGTCGGSEGGGCSSGGGCGKNGGCGCSSKKKVKQAVAV
jgi:cell fate regulator YaaT (PSP1 superfamily)